MRIAVKKHLPPLHLEPSMLLYNLTVCCEWVNSRFSNITMVITAGDHIEEFFDLPLARNG